MSLFDQTGLRTQELRTGSKLETSIEESRRLSPLERACYLQLVHSNRYYLDAVSPKARIRWGQIICEGFSDHFQLGPDKPEPGQRMFLVTLCDRRCCTSHDDKNIDITRFVRILRRGLRGLSYFGMIEPAYYVNVCKEARIYGKRMVCWHLHLLAWGASRKEIRKRIERLNRGILLPIADGLDAAHQKCISKGKLASKLGYILKGPRKAYRLFKVELITADGEIITRFKQKKDDLRPGERLTVFRLMQDMYLDRLAVAGGQGADVLRRVKRRVVRDLSNYAGR
jgi:hypothetical protein